MPPWHPICRGRQAIPRGISRGIREGAKCPTNGGYRPCAPIPVMMVIPGSLATKWQRINPWIPADGAAPTICGTATGYELREAALRPALQMYRVLTGQERKRHFGLISLDPDRPSPTVPKSMGGSTTGPGIKAWIDLEQGEGK